jgi:para-aminobenzoate synthetase component 1
VVSSSPERFLRVNGSRVETCPIKGTRRRGRNPTEDSRLRRELSKSPKDRAELNMIVDLERNDLGRVCRYGTVQVREHARLETHPTVFHLVSTVEGRLRPGLDAVDLLRATFPGGSITGAPKIRAMQIIAELEPQARSLYTGSLGYIGFDGRADLNIVIRTILIKNGTAHFHVGGGIVADSDPEAEYEETLIKGQALKEVLFE